MNQSSYLTILDAIVDMQARGFYFDFNLICDRLFCSQQKCFLKIEEFDILEMYRFAPDVNEQQETILYGIESLRYGLKGILFCADREYKNGGLSIIDKKNMCSWYQGYWFSCINSLN